MRGPDRHPIKLSSRLLEQLGIPNEGVKVGNRSRRGPSNRKEQRKAARVEKRRGRYPLEKLRSSGSKSKVHTENADDVGSGDRLARPKTQTAPIRSRARCSESESPKSRSRLKRTDRQTAVETSPPRISRATQERLATDDAEIAALEKALGVKGKTQVPKSFRDDGLDSLLEGLDDVVSSGEDRLAKRKRSEEDEWLNNKRQKSQVDNGALRSAEPSEQSDFDSDGSSENSLLLDEDNDEEEEIFDEGSMASDLNDQLEPRPMSKRENPYVAPPSSSFQALRTAYAKTTQRDIIPREDDSRLRRQVQGLINRLSEANLTSIVGEVEKMYRDNPRQHVTNSLLDAVMRLFAGPDAFQDTFIILYAGFLAALYKAIGTDLGAEVIQRIDANFVKKYGAVSGHEQEGKTLNNLISLLAALYLFHVVDSRIIYDFVRLFLDDICELNTELLLRIVRLAGPQLRQDDPTSLKDIVLKLQATVADQESSHFSVRTKFMIETINNLKNTRMKTGVAAANITSEHMVQMKKTLGALNARSLKAREPLHVGLRDLRERDKRGTWWLIGASYKGPGQDDEAQTRPPRGLDRSDGEMQIDDQAMDLARLAREQGMNTDVRRSIFIAIMSSTDFNDAFVRLMKLRLKKKQEPEISKVIVQCAGAEKIYNPFYTHLSRRLCSDRKIRISFKFSLWDLFSRLGEGDDASSDNEMELDTERLGMSCLVNIAKMFGILVAEGGLDLGILKKLNLTFLKSKTSTFVEMLLITIILHSQRNSKDHRNGKALVDIFMISKNTPEIANGLRYFLKSVVRKTDITDSEADRDTVRWACKTIGEALKVMAIQVPVYE